MAEAPKQEPRPKDPEVVVIANYEQLAAAIARNIVEMQSKQKPTGPNLKVKHPGEVIK